MKKLVFLIYGLIAYLCFFAAFLYLIGFAGNFLVPKSIDGKFGGSVMTAYIVDILLIAVFGIQHSVMARIKFKKSWTKIVPKPVERSTFVLFTCAALGLIFWQWRPVPFAIWDFTGSPLAYFFYAVFALGWAVVFVSTLLINHFDLFGLRQVYLYFQGAPYTEVKFKQTLFYKVVRHPLMLGFLLALWSTPAMSFGHALFACGMSSCIFIGIHFEESDLLEMHGESYSRYMENTSMILPIPKKPR